MSEKGGATPSVSLQTRELQEEGLQEEKREPASEAGREESVEEGLSVLLGSSDEEYYYSCITGKHVIRYVTGLHSFIIQCDAYPFQLPSTSVSGR